MSKFERTPRLSPAEKEISSFSEWESLFARTIFARHGKTSLNERGVLQGSSDPSLSEKGKEEVKNLAKRVSKSSPSITTILSSPMQRAKESAYIFASELSLSMI